jgi:hypothetical protein
MGLRGLLRCGAAPPPVLLMCFRRPASGSVPDVRSRSAQASTFAQVRTTLTHVHSHSAGVFAYTLALVCTQTSSLVVTSGLDVLHHRQHTVRRLTAHGSCAQERKKP